MHCFKPKADYSRLDFMLYHCGSSDCEKNQSWGPGIRDYYSLYYVTEGSGILNNRWTRLYNCRTNVFFSSSTRCD